MQRKGRSGVPSAARSDSPALVGCTLALSLALGLPATAGAQETDSTTHRAPLHGGVYDAVRGAAVPGAAVFLNGEGYGVLSDSVGVFRLEDVAPGPVVLTAIQFGYEEMVAPVEVPEAGAFVEIELTPQPILLDAVTAVVENISTMRRRLDSRRRSVPSETLAFDQQRLLRGPSSNVLDFLEQETRYNPVPCGDGLPITWTANPSRALGWNRPPRVAEATSSRCIIRRGRAIRPNVYIDEMPVTGGLVELESYPTTQIYLMEVYSSGSEIRAYTYGFMQRMAEKPMALVPIDLWP